MSFKLEPSKDFKKPPGPVCLIIMDGVGIGAEEQYNAWYCAKTPFLDSLRNGKTPKGNIVLNAVVDASGRSVGLPEDSDMGNSEVGHNAFGAGRIYSQGAKLVNESMDSKTFKTGETWKWLLENCKDGKEGTLHLLGLWSDGNVHSHVKHAYALLDAALEEGCKHIRFHILLDGRDVSETSALDYVGPLEKHLASLREKGVDVHIASGGGRMVTTMDRYEADWRIVQRGWLSHVLADTETIRTFSSASEAIQTFRKEENGVIDQFLPPFIIVDNKGSPLGRMKDGDSVILFNFRGDRAIEISTCFDAPEGTFHHFDRGCMPKVRFAGMMQYDGESKIPKHYIVSPPNIERTLGEYLVHNNCRRLSISETQKFGHVTYFFNGNRANKFNEELELYVEIPSSRERENTRPWMKAAEITDSALAAIDEFKPDFVVLNYANGDMVGHTGVYHAAVIAMEAVDVSLSRLVNGIIERNGIAIVSADHGNCETMAEVDKKTGKPVKGNSPEGWKALTSHTTTPVPVMITGYGIEKYEIDESVTWGDANRKKAGIVNVTATCANLLGFEKPKEWLPGLLKPKSL
ncbi:hypothetical protein GpartN1_g645.t1 [Galdieria partita]|uniref:phosphoglycerate mutase (2,3-diphosphoglycerate-independent) n=1 Tax=Galdieria partita TaxID=83374 RepID=A0A9C7PRF9_9RHOD|nr:hypothetical protein GpartN1_g645.t1 [Galdieria partita]